MIRNRDFALRYAGRAVVNKNGEYAGVVAGWNGMHGVILGVDHLDGWQPGDDNDISVSDDRFMSYEYRNAGTLEEPLGELMDEEEAPKHKTIGELIPIRKEMPQTAPEVKPKTPGERIAYYEGLQGMSHSVINGSMSAVYKRQGSALKLVSWGEGIISVTEKV